MKSADSIHDVTKKVVVFTAPSGSGKTTIVRHLLKTYHRQLGFSVSATSREPREGEIDGEDYYFLTAQNFLKHIERGDFLEWEEVYINQYYGTLKSEVTRIWGEEKHIIFDVDVIGAKDIKAHFGEQCLAIFIRPPSIQVVIKRLKKRGSETPANLEKRIARIKRELTFEEAFDKVLINDILDVALKEAELLVEEFINFAR